jgi:hypothetical protein
VIGRVCLLRVAASALLLLSLSGAALAETDNPCAADQAEVDEARARAVLSGAHWLRRYLRSPRHLAGVAADAVSIFADLGIPARDERLRRFALDEARRMVPRAERHFLRAKGLSSAASLRAAVGLLSLAHELGVPHQRLLDAVSRRFARLPRPDAYFRAQPSQLDKASIDDLYNALIGAYDLERAALAFPGRFAGPMRLDVVLAAVARRTWLDADKDRSADQTDFQDHAYLATHVGFVLNDYDRLALPTRHVRRTLEYLDRHLPLFIKKRDIELVAEVVDLAHSAGRSESSDVTLCRAVRFLLAAQNADGSWGRWWTMKDSYNAVHYSWTVVHALRSARYGMDPPFAARLAEILKRPLGL